MWARRSHTLSHLIKISSNIKFKWTKIEQDAFNGIKRIVERNNLLTYPDFNGEFKIHNYDIKLQLGAVISQKGKPIDFYGRKITESPKRYIVTERGILSVIETIKKFINLLLGQILRIYTDH